MELWCLRWLCTRRRRRSLRWWSTVRTWGRLFTCWRITLSRACLANAWTTAGWTSGRHWPSNEGSSRGSTVVARPMGPSGVYTYNVCLCVGVQGGGRPASRQHKLRLPAEQTQRNVRQARLSMALSATVCTAQKWPSNRACRRWL